jgi:magnesium-transporting ATPase (P-type)
MVVVVVGDLSCNGKIRAALNQEEVSATPLQMKLQKIAEDIRKIGLYSAIIIFIVLLVRFAIEKDSPWVSQVPKSLNKPQISSF